MNYRHINRGDIKEGGCAMCKPRTKRGGWSGPYFDSKPIEDYQFEEVAEIDGTSYATLPVSDDEGWGTIRLPLSR